MRKILIMGLPGAGKTTLAKLLAKQLPAVHFEADEVRAHINRDLGFTIADRIEQARRMGWLCDRVVEGGSYAIADFICPTRDTRASFHRGGVAFVVWVDRIKKSRYPSTDRMFESPTKEECDLIVDEGTPEYWAEQILKMVRPAFDPRRPTALFVGRYQPFHAGHQTLIEEGIRRVGQACIAVRDTYGIGTSNPFTFQEVADRIHAGLRGSAGRFIVAPIPNITHIFYGRDVGYHIEKIDIDVPVSATAIRDKIGL